MAKIDITRTELVWPGKYNEDGTLREVPRVSLPFQVIETVNESRATREAKKGGVQGSLFDVYEGKEGDTFEAGWRNKLIWGDNLLVMGSLLEKFAGKIDLIYIDPPFAVGADFTVTTEIGDDREAVIKEQSIIEERAYRDTWGNGHSSYIAMMHPRCVLLRDLLAPSGHLFVNVDWHAVHFIRAMLEDVFGAERFVNEIIWFTPGGGASGRRFARKHQTILWFTNAPDESKYTFNADAVRVEYLTDNVGPQTYHFESNRKKRPGFKEGFTWSPNELGKLCPDVWADIKNLYGPSGEITGYANQKPIALMERIVSAASNKGDLVADFFAGSGSTAIAAEQLGRRWLACDLSRYGIHLTRKRLLGVENCKPFEVLNLGKYERQYWQGVTFGETKHKPIAEQVLYEYLAFILRLYGAQPVAGMAHLHGKKGKAVIHIGAVDAPVTIAEIDAAVDECTKLKQSELHVLGWEWEMGLYDLMVEAAKKKGVKLLLLQIPREVMEQQAAAKGDVRFFELAYLEAEIKQPKKLAAQVALKDFVIPNTELIPEDVRSKVKKWSDYIDYWAVDWDFRNDTFMQGWVAYRTRKERKLPLSSDAHTYEKPGKYRILVKVIDIFGNDTSQAFDVGVK
jgi:adenine-specific DNA-methyltransferase